MGTNVWNSSMLSAVSQGLVKEATVDAAAYRAVLQRMRQGDFDPFVPVAPPAPACADPITPPEVNTDSRGTAVGDGAARLAAGAPAEACRKLCCATEGCDTYTHTLHQAARCPPPASFSPEALRCFPPLLTACRWPRVCWHRRESVGRRLRRSFCHVAILPQEVPLCWMKNRGSLDNSTACGPHSKLQCTSQVVRDPLPPAPVPPAGVPQSVLLTWTRMLNRRGVSSLND